MDEIVAREPREQYLSAGDVKHWIGISDYLFWKAVKTGKIKKDLRFGIKAKYNKEQIKEDFLNV